jgi:hypothetical protein
MLHKRKVKYHNLDVQILIYILTSLMPFSNLKKGLGSLNVDQSKWCGVRLYLTDRKYLPQIKLSRVALAPSG